jgi:hypothetical protein
LIYLQVITKTVSDEDSKLAFLRRMGYKEADASIAITRCGMLCKL